MRQAGSDPRPWRSTTRWVVHLALLLTAAAALGTLQLLHVRIAYHVGVGLVFVGLVVVHLLQRRRTISRLASQLIRVHPRGERRIRLAVSDLVLLVITLNVLVSGIVDWNRGEPTQLPFPKPIQRWHLVSGLALLIFLAVHAWRRRKRFWRSTIR